MRDIRADLRERLEAAEAEAKALEDAANAAAARVEAIKDMLAAEETHFASIPLGVTAGVIAAGAVVNGAAKALPPLEEYLVKAARRGLHLKDDLRDAAIREGYFAGTDKSPGRVVHAKLTNLVKDGTLVKVGEDFVVSGG